MSALHTPGPWSFLEEGRTEEGANRCAPLTICSPGADDLANIYSSDDATVSIPRAEAIANARLIAAAPELLAACNLWEAYQQAIDSDDPKVSRPLNAYATAMDATRAAIAKATGSAA